VGKDGSECHIVVVAMTYSRHAIIFYSRSLAFLQLLLVSVDVVDGDDDDDDDIGACRIGLVCPPYGNENEGEQTRRERSKKRMNRRNRV
jgi:hypothetical protein